MGRKTTGEFSVHDGERGRSFYLRFRYQGRRYNTVLGREWEGVSEEQALVLRDDVIRRVNRGAWSPEELRRSKPAPAEEPPLAPEFREFASEWLLRRERERGRRLDDLRWRLEGHLLPYFAGQVVSDITVADVDDFAQYKLAEGSLARSSINKMVATLSQLLETAVEYDYAVRNVAAGRRRKLPVPRPRRTFLDRPEHIEALLEGAEAIDADRDGVPYRRPLLAVLAFAGPRIGEAMELRWRDVALADSRLRIRGSKTAAADRVIQVVPKLYDELVVLMAADRDPDPAARVFRTRTGGSLGSTNVRKRVLGPAVEYANERLLGEGEEPLPHITPHSLRRTFASIIFAIGRDPVLAMSELGHTTATFTMSVYARAMQAGDGDRERLRRYIEGSDFWREESGDPPPPGRIRAGTGEIEDDPRTS